MYVQHLNTSYICYSYIHKFQNECLKHLIISKQNNVSKFILSL